MASVLPSNLSFFMSRLQGVSTSHFKVNPQTTSSVGPNNLIRFELPSNTLLNFRSIRLLFNANATGDKVSLPNDISSLIERVSVYIGGVLVANGFNGYNTLVHGKAALQGYKCGALSHPEMMRKINYHAGNTNTAIIDASGEVIDDSDGLYYYCIDNFEGFLGSIEPSIMDTGLVSTIVIEIALADATVCSASIDRNLPVLILPTQIDGSGNGFDCNGTGTPNYTVSNMTMQVEVLSLATNVIDTIVEQRVAQVGYLSIPFKNYFSFSNNHTNTTRFNVNSASWDRLWIVYRDKNFATKHAPVRIKGYKAKNGFVSINGTDLSGSVDIGKPEYDFGGVLNTNAEKYKPFYFNFIEKKGASANAALAIIDPAVRTTYQLQINSANVPSYPLTAPEVYAMSMNSLDYYDKNHKITLHQYKMNYFVQCFRFCLPDSDYSRLASGLDCRGVSSSCSLNTTGLAECNVTMFAECTSELRVGAGRQLEVIV